MESYNKTKLKHIQKMMDGIDMYQQDVENANKIGTLNRIQKLDLKEFNTEKNLMTMHYPMTIH